MRISRAGSSTTEMSKVTDDSPAPPLLVYKFDGVWHAKRADGGPVFFVSARVRSRREFARLALISLKERLEIHEGPQGL